MCLLSKVLEKIKSDTKKWEFPLYFLLFLKLKVSSLRGHFFRWNSEHQGCIENGLANWKATSCYHPPSLVPSVSG